MIWFAAILALVIGALFGLITRNFKKGVMAGFVTFIAGVMLSILIISSGIMGG